MQDRYTEYRPISREEKIELFKKGHITLDTNILMTLYRQSPSGCRQLLDLLDKIQQRLWVADHVIWEFMKNRPNEIYGQSNNGADLIAYLREVQVEFKSKMNEFTNRVVIDPGQRQIYRDNMSEKFSELFVSIDNIEAAPDRSLGDDEILSELDELLDGRVGDEASAEEMEEWAADFEHRKANKIPPGYKDAKKEENAAGDLIIWRQILKAASDGKFPNGLISVTGDVKEDLYWKVKGKTLGPRVEMIKEYSQIDPLGSRFWQIDLNEFIVLAGELLSLQVDDVNTQPSGDTGVSRTLATGTWDPDSYLKLIEALTDSGYYNQVKVIELAARNGGFASRDDIYKVCEFDRPRRLNGFSQPVVRTFKEVVNLLDDEPGDLEIPMQARYSGPGKTIGYEVPVDFTFFAYGNYAAWADWGDEGPVMLNDAGFVEMCEG